MKCGALLLYCSLVGLSGDGGECEKLLHALVNEVFLGSVESEAVKDPILLKTASIGVFHAVAVASLLAKTYNKHVFVRVQNRQFRGVVAIANPPGLVKEFEANVSFCGIEFNMVQSCNSPSALSLWPQTDDKEVSILLVSPSALKEKAKLLAASRMIDQV